MPLAASSGRHRRGGGHAPDAGVGGRRDLAVLGDQAGARGLAVARIARGAGSIWVVAWVPELDSRCLAICDENPIGAGADFHLARTLSNAWQGVTVFLGAAMAAGAGLVFERATQAARRRRWQVLAAAAVVGVAWAAWGVTLLLPSTVVAPAGSSRPSSLSAEVQR